MIVLITPTGSRKDQFSLCADWMKNQTYDREVLWIIVDDAYPITTNNVNGDFRKNWDVCKIYPKPRWTGQNTQARNIRAGFDEMQKLCNMKEVEAIFIIEDDDYYRPIYLARMMQMKQGYWAFGETNTIYYNVTYRMYMVNANRQHASLFQTAFTPDLLPHFRNNLHHKFIDAGFWQGCPRQLLFFDNYLSVGIKGMPGRGGIGAGHRWFRNMSRDIEMRYLKHIIGENDAKKYAGYYRDSGSTQYDILTKKRL
jgi:hypothetical protein